MHLLLLRHAKAARPGDMADFDRPLTPAGRLDARAAGRTIAAGPSRPDLALVSPARRARETWDAVAQANPGLPHRLDRAIYDASAERLLALVRNLAEPAAVLVIGHNPGLAELAGLLTGRDGDGLAFPPAALAVVALEGTAWDAVEAGRGRLERLILPGETSATPHG
jgi:phosphohistidine phosphatase